MKILLILGLIVLSSCSVGRHIRTQDSAEKFTPTEPNHIQLHASEQIDKQYKILGLVSGAADSGEDPEQAIKILKSEAAKLGANAVYELRIQSIMGIWQAGVQATGIAVKTN